MPAAVPLAIVGSSVAGSLISGAASKSAANTQAQAGQNASQAQLQAAEESIAAQQQGQEAAQANQQPWINAGSSALTQLGNLLGVPIAASGQYAAPATSVGGIAGLSGGGAGGAAGGPQLVSMVGGVPTMNQQLYASNPAYKQAWDAVSKANQDRFGTGYTNASDPGMLTQELQSYIQNTNPQGLAALNPNGANGQFQPGTVYGGPTGGFAGSTGKVADPTSFGAQSQKRLSDLLGFNGADPTAALRATPGYQFTLDQGLQGVENSAAARGLQLSGATLKDLNNYAQGTADTTYQQQLGDAQSIYNTQVGNLMSLAGLGGSSAGGAAGDAIASGQGIGSTISGAGSAIGSNIIGAGNAQAAGTVGAGNAIGSGLNSIGQLYTLNNLFGNSSGAFQPNSGAFSGGGGASFNTDAAFSMA
jgi:hypothetical protein